MKKIELRGTHAEAGARLGEHLRDEREFILRQTALDGFQTEFARGASKVLKEVFPAVTDEIEALSEALNLPCERLTNWLTTLGCCFDFRGCSAFAFRTPRGVVYGRNNDLPPELAPHALSVRYDLPNKSFLLNTSAFVHGEEGRNDSGLIAAMTFIPTRPHDIRAGLCSLFLVRYILEHCGGVNCALQALRELPIASNCNILLADSTDLAVAECTPEKVFVRKSDAFVYCTNHFTEPALADTARYKNPFRSRARAKTIANALTSYFRQTPSLPPQEYARNLLRGDYGFICQYPPRCHFATVWSTVFTV